MKYRSDIDGLRALAVLPVVAFHLGINKMSGGFVGVDVFFVISGYLIGSIIVNEVDQGRFSFVHFYERRVRRIFPALFAMLALTSVVFATVLPPGQLIDYAKTLLSAVFSVSNIYFWSKIGYFESVSKPLRHTWSLAIEEQFYLLLPITIVLLSRLGLSRRRLAIGLIALVSFVWASVGAFIDERGTFYLLHTRAWELLLGVFLPLGMFPVFRTPLARNLATGAGFLMICASIVGLRGSIPFPGLAALPACLGAALILRAGETGDSAVATLLSTPPARFIGLISYSLYLWHWPIIVWRGIEDFKLPGGVLVTNAAMFLAMIALATLSWWFVERPVRKGARSWLPAKPLFGASAVVVVAASAASLVLMGMKGLPDRFSPNDAQVLSRLGASVGPVGRQGQCFQTKLSIKLPADPCLRMSGSEKNYLLVGDSHAATIWHGLHVALKGVNLMQFNYAGCRPVIELGRGNKDCKGHYSPVFDEFLTRQKVDKLILSGQWWDDDLPGLARTLDWAKAHGVTVVVLGPLIQYDDDLPWLLVRSGWRLDEVARHLSTRADMDLRVRKIATERGAQYISLKDALCDAKGCVTVVKPGAPLQYDEAHLTPEGSELLAERLVKSGQLP